MNPCRLVRVLNVISLRIYKIVFGTRVAKTVMINTNKRAKSHSYQSQDERLLNEPTLCILWLGKHRQQLNIVLMYEIFMDVICFWQTVYANNLHCRLYMQIVCIYNPCVNLHIDRIILSRI